MFDEPRNNSFKNTTGKLVEKSIDNIYFLKNIIKQSKKMLCKLQTNIENIDSQKDMKENKFETDHYLDIISECEHIIDDIKKSLKDF